MFDINQNLCYIIHLIIPLKNSSTCNWKQQQQQQQQLQQQQQQL